MITKADLKDNIEKLTSITICNIAAIGAVRLCETLFSTYYTSEIAKHLISNIKGFFFDVCYLLVFTIIFYAIIFITTKGKDKLTGIFRWTMAIIILASMLLVAFYAQSGFPLDRLIFVYSFNEIIETLTSSNSTTWWIYICIVAIPTLYVVLSKKQRKTNVVTKVAVGALLLAGVTVRICEYDNSAKNRNYSEECNKLCFFVHSTATLLKNNEPANELNIEHVKRFWSLFPSHKFISERTPFLHKNNSQNTIGRYFNLGPQKPNIVIVCVEGLGRENSGANSKYASATPFLDSLASVSLNWENCLSTSQRTVSALPSILGALPFGTYGFMAMKGDVPEFHSLPKILEKNGYDFSFYYGGWGDFDDMGTFITLNNGTQYFERKFPNTPERNDWGLYDKFLFEEAVNQIDFNQESARLDFYLTLTSHKPWNYPDKEHYIDLYKKECKRQGKAENPEYEATASYLYVDEAIKLLFDKYREKPGFDNTVFIITGDHNFNDNTFILERYHVPLIIWSPMLKTAKDMKSVVSHRDITPTLLAMLDAEYNIALPQNVTWLNTGLDTTQNFRCKSFSPQIDLSRELKLLVTNNYYIYGDNVFKFNFDNDVIGLTTVNEQHICDSLRNLQKLYRELDYFVCKNDALINKYTAKDIKTIVNISLADPSDSTTQRKEFTDILRLPLTNKHNIFNVAFRCVRMAPTNSPISVAVEIDDENGKSLYYDSCRIPVYANRHWSDFDYEKQINVAEVYQKGCIMKVYVWNKDNAELYLTDITLNITDIH